MFLVTMTIFRLPYALLVGIVIAFTALIPIFGAFVGCAVGVFMIFIEDPFKALIFAIFEEIHPRLHNLVPVKLQTVHPLVFGVLTFVFHIVFPFILGGAIAFVLNVPMNFVQRHLFDEGKIKGRKYMCKIARPVSMLIVVFGVIGIVAVPIPALWG